MRNTDLTLEQYLKELRKSCNYSQEFVASHLNITRQTYSHYETGRITPPSHALYNLAKLYGIPVENLLDLVVPYDLNTDFVKPASSFNVNHPDEMELFVEYVSDPQNQQRFHHLTHDERLLLYRYHLLDQRAKENVMDIMKVLRPDTPSSSTGSKKKLV